MEPDERREMILRGARNAYPHAVSISDPDMRRIADRLVRLKLLSKAKYKDGVGYRLPEPRSSIVPKRPQRSGPAYEREVQDAMKKLRASMGQKEKPPTRR
jgi:hypothetical protein